MYIQSSPAEGHRFVSSTWRPSTISSKTPTTFMYVKFALRWSSSQKHVSHCCRFLISIRLCTWLCWSHQIHMITCRCCWRSCLAFCRLLSRIICVMAFSWFLSCSIRSYWKRERRTVCWRGGGIGGLQLLMTPHRNAQSLISSCFRSWGSDKNTLKMWTKSG